MRKVAKGKTALELNSWLMHHYDNMTWPQLYE